MIKLGGLVNLKPINEAEDDKYVSIGFGRFKEKGKEDDKDAPTFKKDGDKYVPTKGDMAAKGGDSSAGEEKPKVNIFNKGKEKPKSKKGTSVFDVPGGLDVDDFGGSGALSKHLYGDDEESDVVGKPEGKPDTSKFSASDQDWYTKGHATMQVVSNDNLTISDLQDLFKAKGYGDVTDKTLADIVAKYKDDSYMRDTLKDDGIAKGKFTKRIKDLSAQLKSGEPKSEPAKDSTGDRAGNPEVNKVVRAKAKKMGITPQKLGKEEYQKKMSQAAVAALTDANFHSEARALIAKLEGKPEWAEDPRKSAPDISSPDYDKWRKSSVYSSEYYDADDDTEDLGVSAAQEASWDGRDALDSIAFDLKMNGFKNLAAKLQSVIKESKSTRLKDLV